jgi:hypothetical protein
MRRAPPRASLEVSLTAASIVAGVPLRPTDRAARMPRRGSAPTGTAGSLGRILVACLVLAACERGGASAPAAAVLVEDEGRAPVAVIGVAPVDFRCVSLAPLEAVAVAVGGPVTPGDAPPPSSAAVPRTCLYTGGDPAAPGTWSYDVDCREGALPRGETTMVELATSPGARPILVGRSGVDAADSALFFIDEDAPCTVRVIGPGATRRLALARLIAEHLEPRTAPGKVSFR